MYRYKDKDYIKKYGNETVKKWINAYHQARMWEWSQATQEDYLDMMDIVMKLRKELPYWDEKCLSPAAMILFNALKRKGTERYGPQMFVEHEVIGASGKKYHCDIAYSYGPNEKPVVAIECDGAMFHLNPLRDAIRARDIEETGIIVISYSGEECTKEYAICTLEVDHLLRRLLTTEIVTTEELEYLSDLKSFWKSKRSSSEEDEEFESNNYIYCPSCGEDYHEEYAMNGQCLACYEPLDSEDEDDQTTIT